MILDIVFAAGCFWGVEKHFENIDGVIDAVSGYAGGNYENPFKRYLIASTKYETVTISIPEIFFLGELSFGIIATLYPCFLASCIRSSAL